MKRDIKPHYEILISENSLESFLLSVKRTRIDIAVAFASKTEGLIESILNNENKLNLIIGTINYFSDPLFMEKCLRSAIDKPTMFSFAVDFRGDDSIHWKLYLIAPDIVIIGSPNLTITGLSMSRDTALFIRDKQIYKGYRAEIKNLQTNEEVVKTSNKRFKRLLSIYKTLHRSLLGQRERKSLTSRENPPDFPNWYKQESSQLLPLFIWNRRFTEKEITIFNNKVKPKAKVAISNLVKKQAMGGLRAIGSYSGNKKKSPYYNGEVILVMKHEGTYVHFRKADVVIYYGGDWWLCGYRKKDTVNPFVLSKELKEAFKRQAQKWYDAGKTYLDSTDLRLLLENVQISKAKTQPAQQVPTGDSAKA